MSTSFAPKDFGRAAWDGGPATLTDPRFQYRTFTPQVGKNAGNEVKNVTTYLEYVDPEGNTHKAQYDVGNAEWCQIKSGPEDGADEAEVGTSIANPDPSRQYQIYPDSDFGKFLASLVNGGFDESKLLDGDISVLDGIEVEIYKQPRKEGDKFPLLLVKPGSVKAKGGSKAGAKPAKPVANASGTDATTVANEFIVRFTSENGGTVTQAALVKGAMNDATVKASGVRGDVVALLSKKALLEASDAGVYDAAEKTFTLL